MLGGPTAGADDLPLCTPQCFAKCPFTCQFDWLSDQLCQSLDQVSDYFAKHTGCCCLSTQCCGRAKEAEAWGTALQETRLRQSADWLICLPKGTKMQVCVCGHRRSHALLCEVPVYLSI